MVAENNSYLEQNEDNNEAQENARPEMAQNKSVNNIVQESRAKAQKVFEEKFSSVATNPNARKGIAIISLVAFAAFFYLLLNTTKTPAEKVREEEERNRANVEQKKEELVKTAMPSPVVPTVDTSVKSEVKLPEPPQIVAPSPPEPPPPPTPVAPSAPTFPTYPSLGGSSTAPVAPGLSPIDLTANSGIEPAAGSENKQSLQERRKASIMVVGGGGAAGQPGQQPQGATGGTTKDDKASKAADEAKDKKKTPFLGFGEGALETISARSTTAKSVDATFMGNLDYIIAQGKIVDAVLETAINTEIPGTLRGIVSRDVYSESGKTVLIPKGSRLIGSYGAVSGADSGSESGAASGSKSSGGEKEKAQPTRIAVIWSRIIRPDGVDFNISEPGIDDLGRTGITGYVDNKFWLKMGSAFLTSYLIPTTILRFTNLRNQGTSTTNSTSTAGVSQTTTTGTVGGQQMQDSLNKFRDIATEVVKESLNTNTVITIDQGTTMKVFVNKDIIFPPQFVKGTTKVLR